ncbi:MAG: ComEC family competence protein [Bacteroidetes bacterium]|nr:ComEC family competence protein [Bacteroidota bacterium]
MLHKEIPFIRFLVPLGAGILSAYMTEGGIAVASLLAAISLILIITFLAFPAAFKRNLLFGIILQTFLFAAGFLLLRQELSMPAYLDEHNNATYVCRIKTYPLKKPASYAIMTEIMAVKGREDTAFTGIRGNLLIYYITSDSLEPQFVPGDVINADIKPAQFTNRGNPLEFDYARFMLKKGARYYAFVRPELITATIRAEKHTIREKALIAGRRILILYHEIGLNSQNAGLLAALTLGNKEMIDEDLKDDFSKAGIMHVMAVSGLHAGVISSFVFSILFFMRGRLNTVRVLLSITILWAFAFITGLPPSVERASLMFTFLHAGKLLKRPPNSVNSILAAAFFMLIFKPSDLTSLSFQLSFSAVLFISVFFRKAAGMVRTGIKPLDRLLLLAVVSVLAQAGTLPFTLNAFGMFPVWFLPANIIIIPMASLLIIAAFCLLLISGFGTIAGLAAKVVDMLAGFTIECAGWLGGLPGSGSETSSIPWPETILLLIFMWSLMRFLVPVKKRRLIMPAFAFLLLISVSGLRQHALSKTSEIIVYNSTEGLALGLRNGRDLMILSDTIVSATPALRHASALSLNPIYAGNIRHPVLINHSGLRLMVSEYIDYVLLEAINPDILVVKSLPRSFRLELNEPPAAIVVTSGRPGVLMTAERNNDYLVSCVHYIMEEGAWVLKMPAVDSKKD